MTQAAQADPEPAISLAPPFGLRDDKLPMRGRDVLLEELSNPDPAARVHLVHGLGGCGKTRLALEVAYRAESDGTEVWWVPATEAVYAASRPDRPAGC